MNYNRLESREQSQVTLITGRTIPKPIDAINGRSYKIDLRKRLHVTVQIFVVLAVPDWLSSIILLFVSPIGLLLGWILMVGFISFLLMGIDKLASKLRKRRISERTFLIASLAGGFLGIVAGAIIFHHKVVKRSFWLPVIISIILWIGFLFAAMLLPR